MRYAAGSPFILLKSWGLTLAAQAPRVRRDMPSTEA